MREAAAVDVIDEFRATLFDNLAVDEHVDLVDLELLEDARVVRDDEHGAVTALAVGVHAVADGGKGVDVQAGVGFVQDGELGLQQQDYYS